MAGKRQRLTRKTGERRYKRLFLIAAEGTVTEPEYFRMLQQWMSDTRLKIIKNDTASAPRHVLKRLKKEVKETTIPDGVEAWLVIDKDQWDDAQLQELYNWVNKDIDKRGLAVSNPNFEYWLLLHFEEGSGINSSRECRERLSRHLPGYDKHIDRQAFTKECVAQAITRATQKDREETGLWPQLNGSRVYLVVERMLKNRKE